MKIKKNTYYKIKGNSPYFKKKYGTSNPTIKIEDKWLTLTGGSWMYVNGNPTAMVYGMRSGFEGIPTDDEVFYGKIDILGELVHISELEEIKKPNGKISKSKNVRKSSS